MRVRNEAAGENEKQFKNDVWCKNHARYIEQMVQHLMYSSLITSGRSRASSILLTTPKT